MIAIKTRADYRATRIAKCEALGLCLNCNTPRVAGKKLCQTHLDKRAEYRRSRKAESAECTRRYVAEKSKPQKPCAKCGAARPPVMPWSKVGKLCQPCSIAGIVARRIKRGELNAGGFPARKRNESRADRIKRLAARAAAFAASVSAKARRAEDVAGVGGES